MNNIENLLKDIDGETKNKIKHHITEVVIEDMKRYDLIKQIRLRMNEREIDPDEINDILDNIYQDLDLVSFEYIACYESHNSDVYRTLKRWKGSFNRPIEDSILDFANECQKRNLNPLDGGYWLILDNDLIISVLTNENMRKFIYNKIENIKSLMLLKEILLYIESY